MILKADNWQRIGRNANAWIIRRLEGRSKDRHHRNFAEMVVQIDNKQLEGLAHGPWPEIVMAPERGGRADEVWNAIGGEDRLKDIVPGTYCHWVVDDLGHHPTIADIEKILDHMLKYVTDPEPDFQRRIDRMTGPLPRSQMANAAQQTFVDTKVATIRTKAPISKALSASSKRESYQPRTRMSDSLVVPAKSG